MPDALVIRGGRVLDETGERVADVLVRDGVIVEVAPGLDVPAGARVLDAEGCVVAPGLVDIQVHFREPGREEAETIETGARAAALGGFTAVVAMPNTTPPLDDAKVVAAVLEKGRQVVVPRDVRRLHHPGPRRPRARAARRALRPRGARLHRRRRLRRRRQRDAPRVRVRARAPGRGDRAARRRPGPRRRRAHARGGVVGEARHPGSPRRSRVHDRRARPRAGQAHRRSVPRAAHVDRGLGRAGARGEGRRCPGHLRGLAAAPRAHRRGRARPSTRCSR